MKMNMNDYINAQLVANKTTDQHNYTLEPSVQQTLEQEIPKNSFLSKINVIPVRDLKGQKIGLNSTGSIASRTNTADGSKQRTPSPHTNLTANTYELVQVNYDTYYTYSLIDSWSKFSNLAEKISNSKIAQIQKDRLTIAFNGTSASADTNKESHPNLEDVAVGWLQQIRTNASERVLAEVGSGTGKVTVGLNADYKTLDQLVAYATLNLIDKEHMQDDLRVIVGRGVIADKYLNLLSKATTPSESLSAEHLYKGYFIGGLQVEIVAQMPANTILIADPKNLSFYYQSQGARRSIINNVKGDRYEDYFSSNDGFVVENYKAVALIENLEINK